MANEEVKFFFMKMRIWGRLFLRRKKNLKTNRCLGLIFDGKTKKDFKKSGFGVKFK